MKNILILVIAFFAFTSQAQFKSNKFTTNANPQLVAWTNNVKIESSNFVGNGANLTGLNADELFDETGASIRGDQFLLLSENFEGTGRPASAYTWETSPNPDDTVNPLAGNQTLTLQDNGGGGAEIVVFELSQTNPPTLYGSMVYSTTGLSTIPEVFGLTSLDTVDSFIWVRGRADGKLDVVTMDGVQATNSTAMVANNVPLRVWWKHTVGTGITNGLFELYASTNSLIRPATAEISVVVNTTYSSPPGFFVIGGDGTTTNRFDDIVVRSDWFPGPASATGSSAGLTNLFNTVTTTDIVINALATNTASSAQFVVVSVELDPNTTGVGIAAIAIDYTRNGSWDTTIPAQKSLLTDNQREVLNAIIPVGARWVVTNQSTGGGAASIVAGSTQIITQ